MIARNILWAKNTDPTVHAMMSAGREQADIICVLVEQKNALVKRLCELEQICPRKIRTEDGRTFVYHCPDELVPEETL